MIKLTYATILLSLIIIAACKPANPFVYTPIGAEIQLDETEKVFEFTKPFVPHKQVNLICYTFEQSFKSDTTMPPPRFADGVPLVMDNILVDGKGNEFKLNKLADRDEQHVCYSHADYQSWLDISKRNVSFVRLKVRSNRPIKALKIEWKSHNAWDMK